MADVLREPDAASASRLLACAKHATLRSATLTVGILELGAVHGPRDLGRRELAVARLVASAVSGCAFCIDMNAAGHRHAGLTRGELATLLELDAEHWPALGERGHAAALYARTLSSTPVKVSPGLQTALRRRFTDREIVGLLGSAQPRLNLGLGFRRPASSTNEPARFRAGRTTRERKPFGRGRL